MTEPLLPCPMCGTAAHFFKIDDMNEKDFGGQGICCRTEGCVQIGLMFACMDDPKPTLAEKWNSRATVGTDGKAAYDDWYRNNFFGKIAQPKYRDIWQAACAWQAAILQAATHDDFEARFIAKHGHRLASLLGINAFDLADRDAQIMAVLAANRDAMDNRPLFSTRQNAARYQWLKAWNKLDGWTDEMIDRQIAIDAQVVAASATKEST